jgi:hypothetical protein
MSECPAIQCCPDNPFPFTDFIPIPTFWNTRQCYTAVCPDNPSITATECIEAGTIQSQVDQADADAQALAIATDSAQAELSCAFTSTQQVCLDCPTGNAEANIIPVMTSDTTPIGVCSGSDQPNPSTPWFAFDSKIGTIWEAPEAPPSWLQYQFTSSVVVSKYALTISPYSFFLPVVGNRPTAWIFEASNDGSSWTVLDSQSNYYGFSISTTVREEFTISNTAAYSYYRWSFTAYESNSGAADHRFGVALAELISSGIVRMCASATRSSLISTEDATAKAYAAALALVANQCAATGGGGTSSTVPITMPSTGWGQNDYVASDEYPSVINIPTLGLITKVRVTITGVEQSTDGNQWLFILRGPDGTSVLLWSDLNNSGVPSSWVSPLTLTFDDAAVGVVPHLPISAAYQPSNAGLQPNFNPVNPAPQPPYALSLSAFTGKQAQGGWSLWCASRLRQQVIISGGWSLNITTS